MYEYLVLDYTNKRRIGKNLSIYEKLNVFISMCSPENIVRFITRTLFSVVTLAVSLSAELVHEFVTT